MSQSQVRQTRSQRQQSLELNSQSSVETTGSQPGVQHFAGASGSQDLDLRPDRSQQMAVTPSQAKPIKGAAFATINPLDRVSSEGEIQQTLVSLSNGNNKEKTNSNIELSVKPSSDESMPEAEKPKTVAEDKTTKKKKKKEHKEVSNKNNNFLQKLLSVWYKTRVFYWSIFSQACTKNIVNGPCSPQSTTPKILTLNRWEKKRKKLHGH